MKARANTGRRYYPGGFVRPEAKPGRALTTAPRWLAYREERGRASALCNYKGEVKYFATEADAAAALQTAAMSVREYLRRKRGRDV